MTHDSEFSLEFHNKELKSITREKLFSWNTELDLSVYLVGHVWLLGSPLFAEAAFQGHPLHVLRQLQHPQDIDGS